MHLGVDLYIRFLLCVPEVTAARPKKCKQQPYTPHHKPSCDAGMGSGVIGGDDLLYIGCMHVDAAGANQSPVLWDWSGWW